MVSSVGFGGAEKMVRLFVRTPKGKVVTDNLYSTAIARDVASGIREMNINSAARAGIPIETIQPDLIFLRPNSTVEAARRAFRRQDVREAFSKM